MSEAPSRTLRITEVFRSLQGEARHAGRPTVFVRLTGCPLRCSWCDTAYAFTGGESRSLDSILAEVAEHGVEHVTVTGGEPLAQRSCLDLLGELCDAGHRVSLETSGALDITGVDPRVERVVDLKAPGSGEAHQNRWENLDDLRPADQVKFVLAHREDYDWARAVLAEHGLHARCEVLFSPVHETLSPRELADWVVADGLPVRFQVQLHKLLWGDEAGR